MNALQWNRDYTQSVDAIRRRERDLGLTDKPDRGRGTVSLPAMRASDIGLCVATQIARCTVGEEVLPQVPGHSSAEIAWATTQGQLAWYRAMEAGGHLCPIRNRAELDAHVAAWGREPAGQPIGYILSLEGADSLVSLDHFHRAYDYGLRALGLAHYGPGRYAAGTASDGGVTPSGRELLKEMEPLNVICDITHLTDAGIQEVLETYGGPVWASHCNCRALVPGQRQLSDDQIKALIARDAVIGAVFDAWMLVPGWERGVTKPRDAGVALEDVVNHIDHVCQIAGNARHAGIGSDLDGGFGIEQMPADVDTIADLRRMPDLLASRGYSAGDIDGIMGGNWLRFLRAHW